MRSGARAQTYQQTGYTQATIKTAAADNAKALGERTAVEFRRGNIRGILLFCMAGTLRLIQPTEQKQAKMSRTLMTILPRSGRSLPA